MRTGIVFYLHLRKELYLQISKDLKELKENEESEHSDYVVYVIPVLLRLC